MFLRLASTSFISAVVLTSLIVAADTVPLVTPAEFYEILEKADKPVILDVFAPWCGPCKQLAPIFEEFAQEHKDRYVCLKLNGDTAREFCASLKLPGFPTVFVYKDKKLLDTIVGARTAVPFRQAVEKILENADKELSELRPSLS